MRNRKRGTPAVFQFLRAIPAKPETVAELLKGIDWRELIGGCRVHGLSGLLWHEANAAGVAVPTEWRGGLREDALAMAAVGLRVRGMLLKVLEALAAQGITPVLLKGYGLASRLYQDPLVRPMSDVDLLVKPQDFATARAALRDLGFKPMRREDEEEGQRKERHHPAFWGHEESWVAPEGMVELHWRPMAGFGTAIGVSGPFRRSRVGELEGHPVAYLGSADELVFLATHAAKHLLARLFWLYDLKLLIRSARVNWELVVQIASENRINGPAYLALEAARRATAAEVPTKALEALRPATWRYQRAARFLFSNRRLVSPPLTQRKYATYVARVLLASDSATMAAAALSLADQARQRIFGYHVPRVLHQLFPSARSRRIARPP